MRIFAHNKRQTPLAQKKAASLIIFVLLAAAGFIIYSNTLNSPFTLDDTHAIVDNPRIRITKLTWDKIINTSAGDKSVLNRRPLAMISFALNYYFGQYNPTGYHLVNIVIHIINSILIFFFVKVTLTVSSNQSLNTPIPKFQNPSILQYLNHSSIAFFSALLWLVNPLHTNSVTYIVQRMNSMAAMFFILSMFLYAKGRIAQIQRTGNLISGSRNPKLKTQNSKFKISFFHLYFAGAFISGFCAMGCKETSATLPFFIILYEWYFFRNSEKTRVKRYFRWLTGITVLFGAITATYLFLDPHLIEKSIFSNLAHNLKEFSISQRILTEFRVVVYYISLLLFPLPSRLNLDYDFSISHSLITPVTTLFSLCIIVFIIGHAIYAAKRRRVESFCVFWFFGNLVIESTVIPLALIFEHRTYLPSMLIPLLIITPFYRRIRKKWLINVALCLAVVQCAVWAYERNRVWKDEVTLWRDCVKKSPQKARAHANLGNALFVHGNIDEAIDQCSIALELNPKLADAHLFLACSLQSKGNNEKAFYHFSQALGQKDTAAVAHNNMGSMLAMQGKIDQAYKHFYTALHINPDYADAHLNMARFLVLQGKTDEATEHYLKVLEIDPLNEKAHFSMGMILEKQGKIDDAISHYIDTLRINPNNTDALNNLAWIYATNTNPGFRDGKKAVELAERACMFSGHGDPLYLDTLAAAYAEAKMYEKAYLTAKEAFSLAESLNNSIMTANIKKRLELYESSLPARHR